MQHKLGAFDLWHDPFHKVKEAVQTSISTCDKWVSSCDKLTEQFWKRDPIHPWKGGKFTPEGLTRLSARLQEVSHNWAIPFKIHTPPVGDFGKVYPGGV